MQRGIWKLAIAALAIGGLGVWAWSMGGAKDAGAGSAAALAGRSIPAAGWGPLRLMTANIRVSIPADQPNDWAHRREFLVKQFLKVQPDVLACQEVAPAQGAYLNKELAQWYAYYPRAGIGDTAAGATQSGRAELMGVLSQSIASLTTIYYRNDRFDAESGEAGLVIPEEPQPLPTENAIFSLVVLKEKGPSPATLIVVDCHLRHGDPFAARCALRVREKIAAWTRKFPAAAVVVMGDINHDRTSQTYAALTRGINVLKPPTAQPTDLPILADAFDYEKKPPAEKWGTYHGFGGTPFADWPTDLIVAGGMRFTKPATILREKSGDTPALGWPTDHFLITAEAELLPKKSTPPPP